MDRGPGARAWIVTGLLVVFMMVNFADKSVFGLAADEIRADLGLSATQFGLANSAFFLLFSVAAAAVGLMSDRVRPTWLLLTMAVLWSVAQVPAALGGGLAVLVGSRIVLGAAEGPAFPVAQQTALSFFPNHRRNLPGALVSLGVTLGVITAAPGLTWIIGHHGWRAALWVVAAAGAVWAVAWAVLGTDKKHPTDVPETPSGDSADSAESGKPGVSGVSGVSGESAVSEAAAESTARPPYRRLFGSRTWIGTTVAYFTSYWCIALMLVWMPSYLHNGLGHSSAAAGKLVALPWALGAVVLLGQAALTGRLMRRGVGTRWARGRVGAGLLLLGAVSCLALPTVPGAGAKTALLVLGFGLGGSFPTIAATTISELAPPARRGGALGATNAVVTTAGLIAPAVVGKLVDSQGVPGYQTAIVMSGVLLLVGALAAFTLIDPARDAARLAA
ncbi:MFS transporter [Streptacidiphilus anmyonensis]|uniref:MFS transporter n=1 Tax=Streptacidiphilus anmyonensis TaxID=405782 RepID=UPI0005A9ACDB|nr:MFS transporter [Streptacidiphilus anmyonensis]